MLGHDQEGVCHEDDGDRDDDAGRRLGVVVRPQDGERIEDCRKRGRHEGPQAREPM